MKVKTTITLNNDDRKILIEAARILTAISDASRCWTPNNIYDLVDGQYENVRVELKFDYLQKGEK